MIILRHNRLTITFAASDSDRCHPSLWFRHSCGSVGGGRPASSSYYCKDKGWSPLLQHSRDQASTSIDARYWFCLSNDSKDDSKDSKDDPHEKARTPASTLHDVAPLHTGATHRFSRAPLLLPASNASLPLGKSCTPAQIRTQNSHTPADYVLPIHKTLLFREPAVFEPK
jgi:hypothetical protein